MVWLDQLGFELDSWHWAIGEYWELRQNPLGTFQVSRFDFFAVIFHERLCNCEWALQRKS